MSSIETANLARFAHEFADYNDVVINHYNSIIQHNMLDNISRTDEQIYYNIASGIDVGADGKPEPAGLVKDLDLELIPDELYGTEYYEVTDDVNNF